MLLESYYKLIKASESSFNTMETKCIEYYDDPNALNECDLGLDDCPDNSFCTNKIRKRAKV